MRPAKTISLGVDLVEYRKADSFYRRHRRRLGSFFNRSENLYLKTKGASPQRKLAELLAAKEALFKARGGRWMGVSGFAHLALSAKAGKLRPSGADAKRYRLEIMRGDRYAVARCISVSQKVRRRDCPARGILSGLSD